MAAKRCVIVVLMGAMQICGAGLAAAQSGGDPNSHVGVALKLTTLGIGIEAAVPVAERLNVRAGFNVFTLNHDFDDDGIRLAASLKLRSFSTYLDWFPMGGGFHVSPGLMLYNGNEVTAAATVPGGRSFTLGGDDLVSNPVNPVSGTFAVGFDRVAPALEIGWGNLVPRGERRWSIPFEIGVVYSREPTATLVLGGSACTPGASICRDVATDPRLQADVARQRSDINSDLSVLKALPIISIGFSYKF